MTTGASVDSDVAQGPAAELRILPVQARSREMLVRIERAALELIASEGRDSFRMSQIAARAGCSVGAVWRLFPDRPTLLRWLYPDITEGLGRPREGAGQLE